MQASVLSTLSLIDWQRSFVTFAPRGIARANNARVGLAAQITAHRDNVVLGAACAGERTYATERPRTRLQRASRRLFPEGAFMVAPERYRFQPLFGTNVWRFVRTPDQGRAKRVFGTYADLDVTRKIVPALYERVTEAADIHEAAQLGWAMSAHIAGPGWRLTAPVTTINTLPDRWQLDIGPVLIPDPAGNADIMALQIGFIIASSHVPDQLHVLTERRDTYVLTADNVEIWAHD